jgi:hypothetical protein
MYGVYRKGGSIGHSNNTLIGTYDTKQDAMDKAKNLRKLLSPGEKTYYKMGYSVKEIK